MNRKKKLGRNLLDGDNVQVVLLVAVGALIAIGIVISFSAGFSDSITGDGDDNPFKLLAKQGGFAMGGAIIAYLMYKISFRPPFAIIIAMLVGSFLLIVLVAVIGVDINGAKRWINLGFTTVQPSEFVKVALIVSFAYFLAGQQDGTMEKKHCWMGYGAIMFLAFMQFRLQSDMGSLLILVSSVLGVLLMAGIPWRVLAVMLVACVIGGVAIMMLGPSYRMDRTICYHPFDAPQGGGLQYIMAKCAFLIGGLFGNGLGSSVTKYQYLPEAQTDFVFAIIGEEFGFVGCLVVVALFAVVLVCGLNIARRATNTYDALLATGCTLVLVVQALINIGCAFVILPSTGKPLPFVSAGGSSVVASLIAIGFIMAVHKANRRQTDHSLRRGDLRVVRSKSSAARS